MRIKPCAKCHHPKSHHRTRECRHTWRTRGQTFMGVSAITKWCPCDGYQPPKEKPWAPYDATGHLDVDTEEGEAEFNRIDDLIHAAFAESWPETPRKWLR